MEVAWQLMARPLHRRARMKKNSKQPLRLAFETLRRLETTQLAAVNAGSNTNAAQSTMYAISCAPCGGSQVRSIPAGGTGTIDNTAGKVTSSACGG